MSIQFMPDVGAPLVVTGINLVGETVWPKQSNWITYAMTIVGYGSAFLNRGGQFTKNIGVSSMPLTARLIYDAVRSPAASVNRTVSARTKVGRYPGPAQEMPFQGVKLT